MDSRKHALLLLNDGLSAGQAGDALGVSRQTIQKWKKRAAEQGDAGLEDRSHAPHQHPLAVSREMERAVLRMRRRYKEGPRKLWVYLNSENPNERVPSVATIGRILKRHGLVKLRARYRRVAPPIPSKLRSADAPNDVWCIDFKGEFDVESRRCYPFTVSDRFSRFILTVKSETGTSAEPVQRALWRAFRTYGLPRAIRSDNGSPFVSFNSPVGLSRTSAIWVRLGIHPERIEKGKPYQNGQHERFHGELKKHTASPPAASFGAQQQRFNRYRHHYNTLRPHEALDMRTPSGLYLPSPRSCPAVVPPIEHAQAQEVLKVSGGKICFRQALFHVSKSISGESVGITEVIDDYYQISYGPLCLGHITFRGREPAIRLIR